MEHTSPSACISASLCVSLMDDYHSGEHGPNLMLSTWHLQFFIVYLTLIMSLNILVSPWLLTWVWTTECHWSSMSGVHRAGLGVRWQGIHCDGLSSFVCWWFIAKGEELGKISGTSHVINFVKGYWLPPWLLTRDTILNYCKEESLESWLVSLVGYCSWQCSILSVSRLLPICVFYSPSPFWSLSHLGEVEPLRENRSHMCCCIWSSHLHIQLNWKILTFMSH